MSFNRTRILTEPIVPTLMQLTIPMIWGMASLFSFQLVDTYFISLLGTSALAAVSFTLPLTSLVMSLGIGLSVAVTAMVSKKIGADGHPKAAPLVGECLLIVFSLAILLASLAWLFRGQVFTLLGATTQLRPLIDAYLQWWLGGVALLLLLICSNSCIRASGNTRLASRVMVISGFMNALFDPIFIFGLGPIPAFGLQGAAMATDLSWFLGSAAILWVLKRESLLSIEKMPMVSLFTTTKKLLALGIPSALSNGLNPLFYGWVVMMLAVQGGEAAVAAFGVGLRVEPFALMLAFALSSSLPPFIGQNFGAGKALRIETAWRISTHFILIWQGLIWLLLFALGPLIARLFSDNEEVIQVLETFFTWAPLGYLGMAMMMVTGSTLSTLHQSALSFILHFIRLFFLVLPLTWILGKFYGATGIFMGIGFGHVLSAFLVFALLQSSFRSGYLQRLLQNP